jgi:hypothetical protein
MRRISLVLLLTLLAPAGARADEFYLAVFGGETVPFKPEKTHSFVGAVRVPAAGPAEVVSISWLPASLEPRGLTFCSEEGVNLGVRESVAWAKCHGMRVSVWGPYRIDEELFCRLKGHAARLDSGRVMYKPTDNLALAYRVQNCYHALWAPVAPVQARGFSGAFTPGDAATAKTVRLYSRWILDPCRTHDWVLTLLGVADEPLCRRAFDDRPTCRDAFRSFLRR